MRMNKGFTFQFAGSMKNIHPLLLTQQRTRSLLPVCMPQVSEKDAAIKELSSKLDALKGQLKQKSADDEAWQRFEKDEVLKGFHLAAVGMPVGLCLHLCV